MDARLTQTPAPKRDRITRLLADMVAERGVELAALPPADLSTPYECRRRAALAHEIANLRDDIRLQTQLHRS